MSYYLLILFCFLLILFSLIFLFLCCHYLLVSRSVITSSFISDYLYCSNTSDWLSVLLFFYLFIYSLASLIHYFSAHNIVSRSLWQFLVCDSFFFLAPSHDCLAAVSGFSGLRCASCSTGDAGSQVGRACAAFIKSIIIRL